MRVIIMIIIIIIMIIIIIIIIMITTTTIMYSIYKPKRLKKFTIFVTVHMYIYISYNSRWEKFGDIRNNLFVQT